MVSVLFVFASARLVIALSIHYLRRLRLVSILVSTFKLAMPAHISINSFTFCYPNGTMKTLDSQFITFQMRIFSLNVIRMFGSVLFSFWFVIYSVFFSFAYSNNNSGDTFLWHALYLYMLFDIMCVFLFL